MSILPRTEWVSPEKRKYTPGDSDAICSMRCRALSRPETDSSHTSSFPMYPLKMSNLRSPMRTPAPALTIKREALTICAAAFTVN